jgi:hypothetical protein
VCLLSPPPPCPALPQMRLGPWMMPAGNAQETWVRKTHFDHQTLTLYDDDVAHVIP